MEVWIIQILSFCIPVLCFTDLLIIFALDVLVEAVYLSVDPYMR